MSAIVPIPETDPALAAHVARSSADAADRALEYELRTTLYEKGGSWRESVD